MQIVLTLAFVPLGITAMVAAFAVLNILYTVCWHLALQRIEPLAVLDALTDTMPFALVAIVVMLITHYVTQSITTLWMLLLVRIVVAALLYYTIMRLLHATILQECMELARKKMKG